MAMLVRTYPLRDLVRRARQLAGSDVSLPSLAAPPEAGGRPPGCARR